MDAENDPTNGPDKDKSKDAPKPPPWQVPKPELRPELLNEPVTPVDPFARDRERQAREVATRKKRSQRRTVVVVWSTGAAVRRRDPPEARRRPGGDLSRDGDRHRPGYQAGPHAVSEGTAKRPQSGPRLPHRIGAGPVDQACRIDSRQAVAYATFFARGFLAAATGAGAGSITFGFRPKPIFLANSCRLRA